jgi:hypothetical protein
MTHCSSSGKLTTAENLIDPTSQVNGILEGILTQFICRPQDDLILKIDPDRYSDRET